MMDSSHQYQQQHRQQSPQPSHMLHASPQVRPPISTHYDYLPKRSTPSSPKDGNAAGGVGAPYPSVRQHDTITSSDASRPQPGRNTASTSYLNGNASSSEQKSGLSVSQITDPPQSAPPARKRAQVEDILNPIQEEIVIASTKPPSSLNSNPPTNTTSASKPRPPKPTAAAQPPPTPAPKPIIPPSSGSAITISSSTVSSSKSTPTSLVPPGPVKQPKSIRLHVPLNGSSNVYINFASLAEKTYGPEIFNSKRLLGPQGFASSFLNHDRILDTGSDSEAEDDDAAPGSDKNEDAVDTDATGKKKAPAKKRRRQAVADKYDVDDPFIDDSEALMDQVAAASKDGFFVYSGPLIAEGERAKIDKAEQPKKRKAPAKKTPAEKVPRAKKTKEKGKSTESGVEDVPPVIAQ